MVSIEDRQHGTRVLQDSLLRVLRRGRKRDQKGLVWTECLLSWRKGFDIADITGR